MPAPRPQMSMDEARRQIEEQCLRPAADDLVGVETERLVVDVVRPADPLDRSRLEAALSGARRLPGASRLTLEPGGQVELSSLPAGGAAAACDALAADWQVVEAALADHGLGVRSLGVDPDRRPVRIVDSPRYRAMETFFDTDGPAGRWMMGATASVQVNLGLGDGEVRWRLLHDAGPALIAAFANSPLAGGRPTGWRSARWGIWRAIDPTRTAPPHRSGLDGWVDYALAARTMFIRRDGKHFQTVHDRLPLGRWVTAGHELGWPTADDVTYHLSTLFPPVRPRGWLEVRYLDALPDPWWRVAALVVVALAGQPVSTRAAVAGTEGLWQEAAHLGTSHPALARSADACLAVAAGELEGDDAALVDAYRERYCARGRCPADDALDSWRADRLAMTGAR